MQIQSIQNFSYKQMPLQNVNPTPMQKFNLEDDVVMTKKEYSDIKKQKILGYILSGALGWFAFDIVKFIISKK